jgi:tetratricopeptide (TPR) repeat protein
MSKIFTLQTRAIRAAQEERWDDAISLNQELLEIDPRNTGALNRLGFAYMQKQDTSQAETTYQQVLTLDSSNAVAKKYLEAIKKKQPVRLPKALRHTDFVDEPGKTKSTQLSRLADADVLSNLSVGMDCELKPSKTRISVQCDGKYIGSLPDDLMSRLLPLVEAGNAYTIKVQSLKNNSITVFIRERDRAASVAHISSFPSESSSVLSYDGTEITREEEEPVYMGETGDDEGENELDSESIEEALKHAYDVEEDEPPEEVGEDDED